MNLRPLWLAAFLMFLAIQVTGIKTMAEDSGDLVEVRTNDDVYKSYRDRRGTHGAQAALSYENYMPKEYLSMVDGEPFDSMFGAADMPTFSGEIGYKFNFSLGSLSALVGYGYSRLEDARLGETRVLEMYRTTLKAMYIMDNLMAEPYAAPYASFGVYRMGIDESISETEFKYSGDTSMGTMFTAGILLQTNWLEPDTSRWAYLETGLQNTYIDLFVTMLNNTGDANDPLTVSGLNWGAGMRFEF